MPSKGETMKSLRKSLLIIVFIFLLFSCMEGDDDDDDDNATDNNDDDDNFINETWFDSTTGLTWQNDDVCFRDWNMARDHCRDLNLDDCHDWYLPTISELRSLIRECSNTATDGTCGVTDNCLNSECQDDSCEGCINGDGPGLDGRYWPSELNGEGWSYWSRSLVSDDGGLNAWDVNFAKGNVGFKIVSAGRCVRCVHK